MSNYLLSTPIPPSLGNLTSLTHYQLSRNSFFSSIPVHLQNLSNLVSLKLSNCELNGSIPSALFRLPNLQEVDLSANFNLGGDLSSILPPYSASLNTFFFIEIGVTGAIPDLIGNISSLTLLDLSKCSVQGKLPPTIVNLTQIVMLDISNNMLEGSLPPFGAKSHSRTSFPFSHIDLSYNRLQCRILAMLLGAFENICYVHLRQNLLTSAIPSLNMNLTSLTSLDLSYNKINVIIPPLANMKSLVLLYLSNNLLTSKISVSIDQLLGLGMLDLRNKFFTDVIPDRI